MYYYVINKWDLLSWWSIRSCSCSTDQMFDTTSWTGRRRSCQPRTGSNCGGPPDASDWRVVPPFLLDHLATLKRPALTSQRTWVLLKMHSTMKYLEAFHRKSTKDPILTCLKCLWWPKNQEIAEKFIILRYLVLDFYLSKYFSWWIKVDRGVELSFIVVPW